MKELYIKPQMEEIRLETEGIIATSPGPSGGDVNDPTVQTASRGLFDND